MIHHARTVLRTLALTSALACSFTAYAAVTADEAAKLKSTLTPFGAEKIGNKDGTIPAWTGGIKPTTDGKSTFRRLDPYASDKPLYSITANNINQYADKLSEGSKALLKKYPNYRMDVYPTHRSAAAPQWVYDNTFMNATRAKLVDGPNDLMPNGAFGGIPFPIPKSGLEAMWNHTLRWRAPSVLFNGIRNIQVTADGRQVLISGAVNEAQMPYYAKDGESKFKAANGEYWLVRSSTVAPPMRVGENMTGRYNISGEDNAWIYLTGQRRVRKVPNSCCDTPASPFSGLITFDEINGFLGKTDRFNWKLVGKKELIVPYNANRFYMQKKDSDLIVGNTLNPDNLRWELHRVWVLEATLKPGQRHSSPKNIYYLDEDTWLLLLGDRWDANGQMSRTTLTIPYVVPELPGNMDIGFAVYDLIGRTLIASGLFTESSPQEQGPVILKPFSDNIFTPDGLVGAGIR